MAVVCTEKIEMTETGDDSNKKQSMHNYICRLLDSLPVPIGVPYWHPATSAYTMVFIAGAGTRDILFVEFQPEVCAATCNIHTATTEW